MNISLQQKHHDLAVHQAQVLADILRDVDLDNLETEHRYIATAAGDERKLRGIPAIGRGVAGCINGLRPGDDAAKAAAHATGIPRHLRSIH